MSIGTLVIYIGIAALIMTILIGIAKKGQVKWLMSFLQNFCGVLFIISGFVKAVDPMGTAFKMEQYFAEFEATFDGTLFGFLAPMFPWLSEHAITFSVFMIVLEIVVGLLLILGHWHKFTSWVFFITIVFFTILTGFTFMTGYVPSDVNFFSFSEWGAYRETNMRVTDCGCFGDFIKLEPRKSFLKDIVLLFPALYFILFTKRQHELFTAPIRTTLTVITTIGLIWYCMSNYATDLPHIDFRPFKEGVNIRAQKEAETEAASNVQITEYIIENRETGEVLELPYQEYLSNYKQYPKEEWQVLEQVREEPEIPITKISDFEILASDGTDMSYDILEEEDPVLMIVAYKLKGKERFEQRERVDSVFVSDTIPSGDSVIVAERFQRLEKSSETVAVYDWNEAYLSKYTKTVLPLLEEAARDGVEGFVVAGGASSIKLSSIAEALGVQGRIPFYEADDIMLKTIIRSNPGVVLLRDGVIVGKWHIEQVPAWDEMKKRL